MKKTELSMGAAIAGVGNKAAVLLTALDRPGGADDLIVRIRNIGCCEFSGWSENTARQYFFDGMREARSGELIETDENGVHALTKKGTEARELLMRCKGLPKSVLDMYDEGRGPVEIMEKLELTADQIYPMLQDRVDYERGGVTALQLEIMRCLDRIGPCRYQTGMISLEMRVGYGQVKSSLEHLFRLRVVKRGGEKRVVLTALGKKELEKCDR